MAYYLQVSFGSNGPLVAWLQRGCELPDGLRVAEYARPGEKRHSFAAFACDRDVSSLTLSLYGSGFSMEIEHPTRGGGPAVMSLFEITQEWLLQHGRALIKHFSIHGVRHGFACEFAEHAHRNLFKYDFWGTGQMSSTMLGGDLDRYIPGLYWLNYFSHEYTASWSLDMEFLCRMCGGETERTEHGTILQLYDAPCRWTEKRLAIDEFIAGDSRFFSLARVERPGRMTFSEFAVFLTNLSRRWP